MEKYDLGDPKDVKKLNSLLNPAGISFQKGILDLYVLIEMSRYERMIRRRAGRRTVQTQHIRNKVFTLKSERKSIREISNLTGISVGSVMNILKDYEEEKESDQIRLDI